MAQHLASSVNVRGTVPCNMTRMC